MTETRKTVIGLGVLALAVFAFYLPALFAGCVHMDDYGYFYAQEGPATFWYFPWLNRCGRPLCSLYIYLCHLIILQTHNPSLCHLLGATEVLLLAGLTLAWLRRYQVAAAPAVLLSLVLAVLPCTQLGVTWINCSVNIIAAVLAAAALFVVAPTLDRPGSAWWKWALRGSGGGLLLFAAMCFYQPSALYFFVLTGAALLCAPCRDWSTLLRRAVPLFALGFAVVGGYVVFHGFYIKSVPLPPDPRGALTTDVTAKLNWFVHEPLVNAFSLWMIPKFWCVGVAAVVGVVLAGPVVDALGLLGWRRRGSLSDYGGAGRAGWSGVTLAATKWVGAALLLPLCYGFNLMVKDDCGAYRTLLALTSLVLLLGYAGLARLSELLPARMGPWALNGVLGACAAMAFVWGGWVLARLELRPCTVEFDFVKEQLARTDLTHLRGIHVIRPNWYTAVSPYVAYEDFGLPSSTLPHLPAGVIRRALQELHYPGPTPPITTSADCEPAPSTPPGVLVLDMRRLVYLNPSKRLVCRLPAVDYTLDVLEVQRRCRWQLR